MCTAYLMFTQSSEYLNQDTQISVYFNKGTQEVHIASILYL